MVTGLSTFRWTVLAMNLIQTIGGAVLTFLVVLVLIKLHRTCLRMEELAGGLADLIQRGDS